MPRINILIVDDHALVRKGLVALLDGQPDMKVIGEAPDGLSAVHLAEEIKPDVILMDLEMPLQDGIAAIQAIKSSQGNSKLLVLTSYSDDDRVIAALRAGADGYLLKTAMPTDLVRGILDVQEGRTPLDPTISRIVIDELSQAEDASSNEDDELTEREIEVLKKIARGYTNRQIAEDLNISERTASTHVSNILKKLNLENRTQAAFFALRSGLA